MMIEHIIFSYLMKPLASKRMFYDNAKDMCCFSDWTERPSLIDCKQPTQIGFNHTSKLQLCMKVVVRQFVSLIVYWSRHAHNMQNSQSSLCKFCMDYFQNVASLKLFF